MNWENWFKTTFTQMLKSAAVKAALSKLVVWGVIQVGGFKEWLASVLVKYAFKEIVVPIINFSIRKEYLVYDIAAGKHRLKNVDKAKEENNVEDYLRNMSDI